MKNNAKKAIKSILTSFFFRCGVFLNSHVNDDLRPVHAYRTARFCFALMFSLLFFWAHFDRIFSQSFPSTSPDSANHKILRFEQERNSCQWQFDVVHQWQPASRFQIMLSQNFLTSLLKYSDQDRQWKDNQLINLQLVWRLRPDIMLISNTSSLFFIDQQTSFVNDLNAYSTNFGMDYRRPLSAAKSYLRLSPLLGIKSDKRYEFVDRGMTYAVDFNLHRFEFDEYRSNLSFQFQQDRLGIRQNQNTVFYHQITREFEKETSDTLTVFIDQKSRDYYVSATGEIERLQETSGVLRNKLKYHIADSIHLFLSNDLQNRRVRVSQFTPESTHVQDTREHTDFKFDNQLSIRMNRAPMKGVFDIRYWNQEQIYDSPSIVKSLPTSRRLAFVAPDNQRYFLEIGSQFGWQFLPADSLAIGTSVSRLQYDTPDTSNYDDRDEFQFNFNFTEVHFFSSFLRLHLEATVSLYHLAYIFGERSADNYWKRIFRLHPQLYYRIHKNVNLKQEFEVLANYVDYDFEFDENEIRSFIYRKFASETNLIWRVAAPNAISFSWRIEFEENGKLSWERWTERPLLKWKNIWFRLNYAFIPLRYFQITPGINLYMRDEWRFFFAPGSELKTEKKSNFISFGPTLIFIYDPHPRFNLSGTLMRNAISGSENKKYYINHIDVTLNYNF